MARKLDFPSDAVMYTPRINISVTGDEEITIENYRGIVEFSDENIKVNTEVGTISIDGKNFEIVFISGSTIILGGKFKTIAYGGDKNEA
ncbi:sporulation protein YqfC [Clostridium acetobutylicum]|uniref:sporulation protein YqfC n=1 Tax=Clostridium acetobutylicum TaxID=1488 RepID=UPI001A9AC416|nr:sporulation protein YqfC [Clostridium acetobutylicum]NRY57039.1 sporulation protein YqfC [Clostridium acetobutylicum]